MTEFSNVFKELREIIRPYADSLDCKTDSDSEIYVNTYHKLKNKKPLWFGGVEIKKNYVSYHLMPVYVNPDLLINISPELKKRMQGKSCFNFRISDEVLFRELADLTKSGYEDYKKRGYIS
jgi:hypothetical protein